MIRVLPIDILHSSKIFSQVYLPFDAFIELICDVLALLFKLKLINLSKIKKLISRIVLHLLKVRFNFLMKSTYRLNDVLNLVNSLIDLFLDFNYLSD